MRLMILIKKPIIQEADNFSIICLHFLDNETIIQLSQIYYTTNYTRIKQHWTFYINSIIDPKHVPNKILHKCQYGYVSSSLCPV